MTGNSRFPLEFTLDDGREIKVDTYGGFTFYDVYVDGKVDKMKIEVKRPLNWKSLEGQVRGLYAD
tara:strand:- start:234 stop:428 length:195 start_codon:yes stop_codon:yes gene_type:complete